MQVVKDLIKQKGIWLEDEHLDIAEAIIWECVKLVNDPTDKGNILKHFGIIHK